MTRLRHYIENTGTWGGIKLALMVLALGLIMVDEVSSGTWIVTLPVLVVAVAVTYLARNWLVNRARAVARVMDTLVLVAMVAAVIFRGTELYDSRWLVTLVVAFVGLYLGASFWLLSDPRIEVQR